MLHHFTVPRENYRYGADVIRPIAKCPGKTRRVRASPQGISLGFPSTPHVAEGARSGVYTRLSPSATDLTTTMSFPSLRNSRDKRLAKSLVAASMPSGGADDSTPGDLPPPPPENLGFSYDLPNSMEMKVVSGKGRAIFSTVNSKPGFAPIHCYVLLSDADPYGKVAHCSIADLVCWCCRPQNFQDIVLIAAGSL